MTDSDNPPELVDSSEEEGSGKNATTLAEKWLKKDGKFLSAQENWMRIFCFCPFLFGCNNVISAAWIRALINVKLILNEARQYEITYFEWPEWECLDLLDFAVKETQKTLRNPKKLGEVLECAERLEDCKSGVIIDETLAIEEAEKTMCIAEIWGCVLKNENALKREKAAKFAVLYIIKIYREHVVYTCEKKSDFVECTLKEIKKPNANKLAEEHKKKGNAYFNGTAFEEAVKCYSDAAKDDPCQHVYYGNRALAYIKVKKYKEALADARRAITLKPDFPKGHHRYALAFYELGQLDSAIKVNEAGLKMCSKSQDEHSLTLLREQEVKYTREKKQQNNGLTPIPKDLDKKLSSVPQPETDLTEKLGCKVPDRDDDIPELVQSEHEGSDFSSEDEESDSAVSSDTGKAEPVKEVEKVQVNAEEEMKKKQEKQRELLKSLMREGSESYRKQAYKLAFTTYGKALELVKQTEDLAVFEMDEEDLVALKYVYAMAGINTGVSRNITEGMDKLYAINTKHENVKFPAVHYGFAKGYVMFNRYADGLSKLEAAERIASKVRYPQVTYPGTSELIEDTTPEGLQAKISEMMQLCKCPPPPDAICRYHTSKMLFDDLTTIYLSDPDFRGYFKMVCQMDCVVSFHVGCWKDYKTKENKQNDKDILDTKCPTPDCQGHIIKIQVIRPDSTEKEYVSDKHSTCKENQKNKKHSAKQKPSNEQRITKKKQKKDKRKHRRQEHSEHNTYAEPEIEIVDGASASAFIEDIEVPEYTLPSIKNTTVLKRDHFNDNKSSTSSGKSKKSLKKKDKSKQILNMEVNFTDGKADKLLSENSVLSDDEKDQMNGANIKPFSVPKQLQKDVAMFENSYTVTVKANKPDEVTENLFSFFAGILEASGPLPVNDPQLLQEMEVFPFEAIERIKQVGGLGDFLKQSLKFAVIDNVVSIMSHAKAARELALKRKRELEASGIPPAANDWYTVGKSVNNVDSLTDSVKVSMDYSAKVSGSVDVLVGGRSHSKMSPSSSVTSVPPFSVSLASPQPSPSYSGTYAHWSDGVNSFSINSVDKKQPSLVNLFDSIDDTPLIDKTVKPSINDLDDIDVHSDAYRELRGSQDSSGRNDAKSNSKLLLDSTRNENDMSRSSSKSDVSERSELSGFSSDAPKPLKPLRSHFGAVKNQSNSPDSWSLTGKENLEDSDCVFDSVSKEIQRVGEEYVRKTDEEFIAELAKSVVDMIYNGKPVSKQERLETLQRVSADIAKDFEKNDAFRKQGAPGHWNQTPASSDYTDSLGKFAMDFMKKHYDTSNTSASPTSNVNFVYPQQRLSATSKEFKPKQNSNFNSLFYEPVNSSSNGHFLDTNSVTESSGYNLFSGPSFGIGKFPTPLNSSASYIPPPVSASYFYSSEMLPNHGMPGIVPSLSPSLWPQFSQTPNSISAPELTSTTTYIDAWTMTEDSWKKDLFRLQEERDRSLARISDMELHYQKLQEDVRTKNMKIVELDSQILTQQQNYEREVSSLLQQKSQLRQELQKTQETLQGREKQEAELRDKMAGQEIRVNNIAMMAKDQREKDISTMKQIKERSEYFQQNYESQQERAQLAEIEILTMKLKDGQGYIERSIKEASLNHQRMSMVKQKYMEEQKPVSPLLEQGLKFWSFFVNKAKESLQQLQCDYSAQLEEIKNGKQLSELTQVPGPSLPDVPEGLQKSMQFLQHGFMMSRKHGLDPVRGSPSAAVSSSPATTVNAVLGSASHNTMAVAPNVVMPKPIRPPGLTPRPLSSLHKGPPGAPQRAPLRPIGAVPQPMSSFEKLVSKLQTVFPGKSRLEVSVLIQELRQSRGGSLSGLTIEEITSQVVNMIQARERKPMNVQPSVPPPGISSMWAFTSNSGAASQVRGPTTGGEPGVEMYDEEQEDPCVICHEEMDSLPVVTLNCGHVFHDECIRKWFQEQSTCPNCRVHALLADEFPSLQ